MEESTNRVATTRSCTQLRQERSGARSFSLTKAIHVAIIRVSLGACRTLPGSNLTAQDFRIIRPSPPFSIIPQCFPKARNQQNAILSELVGGGDRHLTHLRRPSPVSTSRVDPSAQPCVLHGPYRSGGAGRFSARDR